MTPDSYNGPWKPVLENFSQELTACLLPGAHADSDWDKGYESVEAPVPHRQ